MQVTNFTSRPVHENLSLLHSKRGCLFSYLCGGIHYLQFFALAYKGEKHKIKLETLEMKTNSKQTKLPSFPIQ